MTTLNESAKRFYNQNAAYPVTTISGLTPSDIDGAQYVALPNGDEYKWSDTQWIQTASAGSSIVRIGSDATTKPEYLYLETGAITETNVASGTDVYVSPDISQYNQFVLEVTSITGTSPVLSAYATYNGTDYSATGLVLINLTSGALIAGGTGITAAGDYAIAGPIGGGLKMKGLKLTLTGGAADLDIVARGAHGVV